MSKYFKKPPSIEKAFHSTDCWNGVTGQAFLREHGKTVFWNRDDLADFYLADESFRLAVDKTLTEYNSKANPQDQYRRPRILDYIERREREADD